MEYRRQRLLRKAKFQFGLATFAILSLPHLTACVQEDPFSDPMRNVVRRVPEANGIPPRAYGCIKSPRESRYAELIGHIDWRDDAIRNGKGFVKLLPISQGFIAVHTLAELSMVLDTQYQIAGQWKPNPQPAGEIIAASASDKYVWLLAKRPPTLSRYSFDGVRQSVVTVDPNVTDVTAAGSAAAVVASFAAESELGGPLVTVMRYSTNGGKPEILLQLSEEQLAWPRVNLPGRVPVFVRSYKATIAVVYPMAGLVDIFGPDGQMIGTTRLCIPAQVERGFRLQAEEAAKSRTYATRLEPWYISDLQFNDDGSYDIASPIAIDDTLYQKVTYTREGVHLTSAVFGMPLSPLSGRMSFIEDNELISLFTWDQHLAVYDLTTDEDGER